MKHIRFDENDVPILYEAIDYAYFCLLQKEYADDPSERDRERQFFKKVSSFRKRLKTWMQQAKGGDP